MCFNYDVLEWMVIGNGALYEGLHPSPYFGDLESH